MSVVIALMLVPYGTDDDRVGIHNLKQCHVPRGPKRDDEFPNKTAFPYFAAAERAVGQQLATLPDRYHGPFGDVQIPGGTGQFTFEDVVKQPF